MNEELCEDEVEDEVYEVDELEDDEPRRDRLLVTI